MSLEERVRFAARSTPRNRHADGPVRPDANDVAPRAPHPYEHHVVSAWRLGAQEWKIELHGNRIAQ
jgi:hypothetical protein